MKKTYLAALMLIAFAPALPRGAGEEPRTLKGGSLLK
jgi:hypothetical protein